MLAKFFIDRPIFAWVIALLLTGIGLISVSNMAVNQYPDVAPPAIEIETSYPGASAEEVADSVVSIIENQLNGAKGLMYYESVSNSQGSGNITVTFEPGTDADLAQVDVQNRVASVTSQLPPVVNEQGVKFSQSTAGFLMVGSLLSTSTEVGTPELVDYVTRHLQNPISRIPGVGRFQLFAAPRAMRIWLDPDRLAGLNLSVNDVAAAVRAQNFLIPAGTLGAPPNADHQRVATPLRVTGQFTSVEDFENTIIRAESDGALVRIKDVARVDLGLSSYVFQAKLNGKPTVAFGIVLAPGANALETEARVLAKLDELSAAFPTGMSYAIPYNSAPFIQASIDQVLETLLEAMLLVFAVMFIFLQSARYTLIPALGVPVAMLGAFTIMHAMGMSINVLTMFAMVLAIGNLVDDSIVVVENVARIMAEEGRSARDATLKAMPQVFGAIVGITIILIVVFLPLAFMPGSVGVIYEQFAVAMAVSILFSGILTLTFTPALCATLLKPVDLQKQRDRRGPLGWFNRGFHRTSVYYSAKVHRMVRQPVRYLLVFLILTILMGWLYARLPGAFLPQEDQGTLFASIQLPTDASATRTAEVIDQVDRYFQQDPNVASVLTVRGFSFEGSGLPAALAFVKLKPFDERTEPGQSASAVAGKATGILMSTIADARVFVVSPPTIRGLGSVGGFDFRLQNRSNFTDQALFEQGQRLVGLANEHPALSQVRISGLGPATKLDFAIDRDKLAAMNVEFSEVVATLGATGGQLYLGQFPNLGRMQQVWLQLDEPFRMAPDDVMQLHVRNQDGAMVPLASFVTASWSSGATQIDRYNSYDSIKISGSAAPGYSSGDAIAAMESLMTQMPPGLGYAWTGSSLQEIEAGAQGPMLLALAFLTVFLVLAALYESWAIPLSVMLLVPLGMLGTVAMMTLVGLNNDVFFQVGMVTVIGLSAKNAVLIVEFAKDLYAEGMDLYDATAEAARLRFRPILMTSFAFIFGVLPLIWATGASAASQEAVGYAVVGGMLAATPFAVIYVPIFFVTVMRIFKTKVKSWTPAAETAQQARDHLKESP